MRNLKSWVREQIPLFLKTGDYEKFRLFLEAYYDFLEQEGQANDVLFRFNETSDIDTTLEPFIKHFVQSFAFAVPDKFFDTKRDALKHFKEINSIKGTPNSYKLLFQFLFNEDVEIYYPEQDILRPSAADWQSRNYMSVSISSIDATIFEGKWVKTAFARFFVKTVIQKSSTENVWYLNIDETQFNGYLQDDGPEILWIESDSNITAWTVLSLSKITVIEDLPLPIATNRTDQVFVISRGAATAIAQITSVKVDNSIRMIELLDQSIGWEHSEGQAFVYDLGTVVLDFEFSSVFKFKGTFLDARNQPSGQSKIQDGRFYSPYVYLLKTGQSIERWKDIVKSFIHPAGVALFAQIFIYSSVNVTPGSTSTAQSEQALRSVVVSFIELLYNFTTSIRKVVTNTGQSAPGNAALTFAYFEQNKFLSPPYEEGMAGTANVYRQDSTLEFEPLEANDE